jgi:hypothetical protein
MRPLRGVLMRALLASALVTAVAGCASPDESETFQLSGSFTADRTQEDLDEFDAIVAPYSDDVAIMESFPEQFSIRGIVGGCEQLRSTLDSKDYIASVSACRVETDAGDGGDEATSSP